MGQSGFIYKQGSKMKTLTLIGVIVIGVSSVNAICDEKKTPIDKVRLLDLRDFDTINTPAKTNQTPKDKNVKHIQSKPSQDTTPINTDSLADLRSFETGSTSSQKTLKPKYWKCTDETGVSTFNTSPCEEKKQEKPPKPQKYSHFSAGEQKYIENKSSEEEQENKCRAMRTSHIVNPTSESRNYIDKNCQKKE